jgi:hypothetical protein
MVLVHCRPVSDEAVQCCSHICTEPLELQNVADVDRWLRGSVARLRSLNTSLQTQY